jgi:hypothetical protein
MKNTKQIHEIDWASEDFKNNEYLARRQPEGLAWSVSLSRLLLHIFNNRILSMTSNRCNEIRYAKYKRIP